MLAMKRGEVLRVVVASSLDLKGSVPSLPIEVEGPMPLDTAQVYSVMEPKYLHGKMPTLMDVARVDGLRGLYRGYGATLLSFGPFSALFFTLNHVSTQR